MQIQLKIDNPKEISDEDKLQIKIDFNKFEASFDQPLLLKVPMMKMEYFDEVSETVKQFG